VCAVPPLGAAPAVHVPEELEPDADDVPPELPEPEPEDVPLLWRPEDAVLEADELVLEPETVPDDGPPEEPCEPAFDPLAEPESVGLLDEFELQATARTAIAATAVCVRMRLADWFIPELLEEMSSPCAVPCLRANPSFVSLFSLLIQDCGTGRRAWT
jgi:hypothetical protein